MKKNTIKQINNLTAKMPKTLNEALNFNNQTTETTDFEDSEIETPVIPDKESIGNTNITNASQKAEQLIDNIRKMSLKAMAELADTPEDTNYIMLKKIWSMTERKPEQDKNNNTNV